MSSSVKTNYKWSEPHCVLWNSSSSTNSGEKDLTFEGAYTATIDNVVKRAALYSVTVTDADFTNYDKLRFYGTDTTEGASHSINLSGDLVGKVFYSQGGINAKFDCSSNNFTDWTRSSSQPT